MLGMLLFLLMFGLRLAEAVHIHGLMYIVFCISIVAAIVRWRAWNCLHHQLFTCWHKYSLRQLGIARACKSMKEQWVNENYIVWFCVCTFRQSTFVRRDETNLISIRALCPKSQVLTVPVACLARVGGPANSSNFPEQTSSRPQFVTRSLWPCSYLVSSGECADLDTFAMITSVHPKY